MKTRIGLAMMLVPALTLPVAMMVVPACGIAGAASGRLDQSTQEHGKGTDELKLNSKKELSYST